MSALQAQCMAGRSLKVALATAGVTPSGPVAQATGLVMSLARFSKLFACLAHVGVFLRGCSCCSKAWVMLSCELLSAGAGAWLRAHLLFTCRAAAHCRTSAQQVAAAAIAWCHFTCGQLLSGSHISCW
jgi:hypothetical protein